MLNKVRQLFKIQESDLGSNGPILSGDFLQFNMISLGRYIFSNFRLLIISFVICMMISSAFLYFIPDKYLSNASILPSGKGENLSLLAEMTGLAGIGTENNENSSALYPEILNSRQIKEAVLNYQYNLGVGMQAGITLKDYFGTSVNEHLLRNLEKITSIGLDKKTGLITISVETVYPILSQAIVRRYLAELEDYNMNRRKSSASERVKYLDREAAEREIELRQAEDNLEKYQMANRSWDISSDPEILSNLNRKKREIMAKTETYLFLKNQYDLAKLEAQKDIPIIRILDNPSLPLVKSGPPRLMIILISGFAGMIGMILFLLIISVFKNNKKAVSDHVEMPVINRQTTLTTEEINR